MAFKLGRMYRLHVRMHPFLKSWLQASYFWDLSSEAVSEQNGRARSYNIGVTGGGCFMERWLTSSFEDRESALISRRYGVHGFFIQLLY